MKQFLVKYWIVFASLVLLGLAYGLLLHHGLDRLLTNPMGTPAVSDTPTRWWLDKIVRGNLYSNPGVVFDNSRSVTYPPIFYYLWHFLGGGDYTGGLITLVSTLLTGVMLFFISKKIGLGRWTVLPTCLFFLSNTIVGWSSVPRPDGLALLFTVVGIFICLKEPLWSIPWFVFALFTKQTYFVAPLAMGIYLLTKDWKKALIFGAFYLTAVFVWVCVFNRMLPGFVSSMILAYKNTRPDNYWIRLVWMSVVIIVTNLVIPLAILAWVKSKVKFGLFGIWFLTSLVVMIIMSGKWGSADNYGFELITVSCLLTAAFIGPIVDKLELRLKKETI